MKRAIGIAILFATCLFTRELTAGKATCPAVDAISPCLCQKDRPVVVCTNIADEENFTSILRATRGMKGVELNFVTLRYIPEQAFNGTNIKFLEIKHSSILALSETENAFKGLEDSLYVLTVTRCPYASTWDWSHFSGLRNLKELEISDSSLPEIPEEFLQMSRLPLVEINFKDNNIDYLPENAFATFKDLKKVSLDQNALKMFPRSMLPKPAKRLASLGLSHNSITEIPSDMFSEMPSLRYLFLGGNPILTLPPEAFKPIAKQLLLFILHDAPIHCDCNLQWLTKKEKMLRLVYGTCNSPVQLKNKKITELESKDLKCGLESIVN